MATRNTLWHLSSAYNDMRRGLLIWFDLLAYAHPDISALTCVRLKIMRNASIQVGKGAVDSMHS